MNKFFRAFLIIIVLALMLGVVILATPYQRVADVSHIRADAKTFDTRIIRDNWGVPHIFGDTDADTSFGLGYAHAEDDWATIQDVLIGSRGESAKYRGKGVAPQDYLFDLFKVREAVEAKYYTDLSEPARAMAEAYAAGLNLYAVDNPDAVYKGLLPIEGQDVIAGMTWAVPFFYRMDGELEDLFSAKDKPKVSPWAKDTRLNLPEAVRGSNAFAVAPSRSEDGHTRLIVNSHQPMTGPYAWYEAHVISNDGLNLAGAGFPGTPVLAQGLTPTHGWTHTVNRPDLIDIYALEVDDVKSPTRYKLDGEWVGFDVSKSKFRVKVLGPFSLPITRDVLWSKHGPVLSTDTGHYALRFAGLQDIRALEQWYAMSKAEGLNEWLSALEINGVLSFNMVYADKDGNIGHFYNARMPERIEGPDWKGYLPGDQSALIWEDFKSPSDMPRTINPDSGWVFSANSTPFMITDTPDNNVRSDFSATFGIEDRVTNRARQAMALLEPDAEISEAELLSYRADKTYHSQSNLMQFVGQLVATTFEDPLLIEAQSVLKKWDGNTDTDSRGAALAVITGMRALGYEYIEKDMPPKEAFLVTATELMSVFGRLDPKWGQVNRLQRGEVDLPLGGAPDVLRAIYSDRDGLSKTGVINAFAGDTHIMYGDWDENGDLVARSIHQYGSATLDKTSPHYADQAALFVAEEYKDFPMTLDAVLAVASRDYRPGKDISIMGSN